jgi:competence protein ComEA
LKRVIKEVKDFFTFSKGERRGVLVLTTLILLLILFNFLYPQFVSHQKYDHSAFDKEVKAFLNSQEIIADSQKTFLPKEDFNIMDADHSAVAQKLYPFPFDPNTLTHEQWIAIGLTEKQVKVIEKYRVKGGKYYKKEDFKKMYCISANEYEILEPFIEIKISKPEYTKSEYPKKETVITKTEINSASIEELKKIKGIGNYFATAIVEYRIKLGGYFSIMQLLEIPKMDTSRFNPLIPFLEVNPNAIRKINVNQAGFDQLKSHPYIGYNIALSLINYRTKHGNYALLSDIKKSMLINDKNYEKISYYLCVE